LNHELSGASTFSFASLLLRHAANFQAWRLDIL